MFKFSQLTITPLNELKNKLINAIYYSDEQKFPYYKC